MQPIQFDKKEDLKIISEEVVYQGFGSVTVYQLQHKLFSGGFSDIIQREVVQRKPIAAALPYDPVLDKVVLIQQCRLGALAEKNPWLLEGVAGIMADEDKSTADLIKRELLEESGLLAKKLHKICEYWVSPGSSNEFAALYCVEVDVTTAGGIHGLPEEHEDIYVHVVDREEAYNMVKDGRINNALSVIAVQWLQLNQNVFEVSSNSHGRGMNPRP